jgi:hypothetical protein
MAAQLHFAVNAFALELLLERPQRLVDIVVANENLHKSLSLSGQKAMRGSPFEPAGSARR